MNQYIREKITIFDCMKNLMSKFRYDSILNSKISVTTDKNWKYIKQS